MNEARQNSAAPSHGLMQLMRAANSRSEALSGAEGEAGRAVVSLSFLNVLSNKGFL